MIPPVHAGFLFYFGIQLNLDITSCVLTLQLIGLSCTLVALIEMTIVMTIFGREEEKGSISSKWYVSRFSADLISGFQIIFVWYFQI